MRGASAAPLQFRLCAAHDADLIRTFLDETWGSKHPLVHCDNFFNYYYRSENRLQFALAQQNGLPVALAGYILANMGSTPDLWVSIWCSRKGHNGSGLELMDALPRLTGARLMACNNIRPQTMPFYTFLGYTAARLPHYYRLADRDVYCVARVAKKQILPVASDTGAALQLIDSPAALARDYVPHPELRPFKDIWYLTRRYFQYPGHTYQVWGVYEGLRAAALLVTRRVAVNGTHVLRIVDYVGQPALFGTLGGAIDALITRSGAEYADMYCYGIHETVMAQAGFCARLPDDVNIIPNYLDPLLSENTEYYFFTSDVQNFIMCKADGDQDRPRVEIG